MANVCFQCKEKLFLKLTRLYFTPEITNSQFNTFSSYLHGQPVAASEKNTFFKEANIILDSSFWK